MDEQVLKELFLKTRHLYVKLTEFEELTRQLGEAVSRPINFRRSTSSYGGDCLSCL